MRDGVMTQFALYEAEIVDMPQVFLPFAPDAKVKMLSEEEDGGGEVVAGGWKVGALNSHCKLQLCVRSCILVLYDTYVHIKRSVNQEKDELCLGIA